MNDDQQAKPEESQEPNDQWAASSDDVQDEASERPASSDVESRDTSSSEDYSSQDAPSDEPMPTESTPMPSVIESQPVPPVPPVAPPQPAPVMTGYAPIQPVAPVAMPAENPGQGFGIAGIILGVLAIWPVGLPLSIVSMVKSSKVNASKTLGIVGLVINILAVLGSGLFLLIAMIGYAALQERESDTTSSYTINTGTISLDENYTPTNGDVYFDVPSSMTGWAMTKSDEDGVNEFTKDDNTQRFMTYQGVQSELRGQDRETTAAAMTLYVSEMKATSVPNSDATASVLCKSGKQLQFMTRRVTMTSEGTEFQGIVAVRMYEGHELSLIYLATTDEFSNLEWTDLVSQVSIMDGTQ
jgi:hypothetical protein